jgi:SAM-dependent methyltransferase
MNKHIDKKQDKNQEKNIGQNLQDLTTNFYSKIAKEFDATRHYQWAGWDKLAGYFREAGFIPSSVLDIACGNGRFLETLLRISPETTYLGIDNNKTLLKIAEKEHASQKIIFKKIDIYSDWDLPQKYHLVVAFGITHHLVNAQVRIEFFSKIKEAMNDDGIAVVSFWDFLSDEKLSKKIITRKKFLQAENSNGTMEDPAGLNSGIFDSLRKDDYILDWKEGKTAYRFCHYYPMSEINDIFTQTNLSIVNDYFSDGPNNRANHYFVLKKDL